MDMDLEEHCVTEGSQSFRSTDTEYVAGYRQCHLCSLPCKAFFTIRLSFRPERDLRRLGMLHNVDTASLMTDFGLHLPATSTCNM
ncbi:hypothetical protein BGZ63DRAFT_53570 [Mariannaea sp. PMI_226]|nr:hypothetical protein BGZ63DRAFT_53570 [Mariannaea sp. PMI_226]